MTFENFPTLPLDKRWHQQLYPAPIVVAIIERNGRFLLIQRNSKPYQGMWALVGGKWDFGEELATAVLREVHEETALTVEFIALRAVLSEQILEEEQGSHFILFICAVTAVFGTATEQNEGKVAWFTQTEIGQLNQQDMIIPSDFAMLTQFATAETAVSLIEAKIKKSEQTLTLHQFKAI